MYVSYSVRVIDIYSGSACIGLGMHTNHKRVACNADICRGRASARISINRGRHAGFAKF